MPSTELTAYARANHERYLDELRKLVAIPSISAHPEARGDVRRCAEAFVRRMDDAGLQSCEVLETGGNPVAYG